MNCDLISILNYEAKAHVCQAARTSLRICEIMYVETGKLIQMNWERQFEEEETVDSFTIFEPRSELWQLSHALGHALQLQSVISQKEHRNWRQGGAEIRSPSLTWIGNITY